MASVIRTTVIDSGVDEVWAAVRDFGALHERLVPGFVVDCPAGRGRRAGGDVLQRGGGSRGAARHR